MAWKNEKLKTEDGTSLNLYHLPAKGKAKAIVQINHGLAEHAARYERFADALSKAGYTVFAHDHRGHGHTQSPGASLGSFGPKGWDAVIDDVNSVNKFAREANPGLPLFVFGHSMGSIISFNFALKHPQLVDGLALWNSGTETGLLGTVFKLILRTQKMFLGSDVPSGIARIITFEAWNKELAPNRTESDWLSRDEAEVDKYIADPLCGFPVSIGMWLDLLSGLYFAADDKNLTNLDNALPIHLVAGDQDPCTLRGDAVSAVAERMKNAGLLDVTFDLLKDTRHESLNELTKEVTTAKFIDWLNAKSG